MVLIPSDYPVEAYSSGDESLFACLQPACETRKILCALPGPKGLPLLVMVKIVYKGLVLSTQIE